MIFLIINRYASIIALLMVGVLSLQSVTASAETSNTIGKSVQQFGALGDSKTDDTQAIQKALDFAANNKSGNPVIFPSGGYVISRPLVVPRNVDMIGTGLGFSSSLIPINGDAIWLKGATQPGGFVFRNKIASLTINMRRAKTGKGIVAEHAYNLKLIDVFIYEVADVGVEIIDGKHITLDNVIVYGKNEQQGKGIKIVDSIVNMNNIDLENMAIGLELGPDQQDTTAVSVFGGFIERFGQYGIHILNQSHNTFIGLNIQADHPQKKPVLVANNTPQKNTNNTFIGGFIGYAKPISKQIKMPNTSLNTFQLIEQGQVINVGE
jgi:hypothetical protein